MTVWCWCFIWVWIFIAPWDPFWCCHTGLTLKISKKMSKLKFNTSSVCENSLYSQLLKNKCRKSHYTLLIAKGVVVTSACVKELRDVWLVQSGPDNSRVTGSMLPTHDLNGPRLTFTSLSNHFASIHLLSPMSYLRFQYVVKGLPAQTSLKTYIS